MLTPRSGHGATDTIRAIILTHTKGSEVFQKNEVTNGTKFTFRNGYTLSVVWRHDPDGFAEVALLHPDEPVRVLVGMMGALAKVIGKPDPGSWILHDITTDEFAELMRYVSLFHVYPDPDHDHDYH